MKPILLILSRLPDSLLRRLDEHFDCYPLDQLDEQQARLLAPRVRGLVATGESTVTAEQMTHWPALEIISVLGVGYDGIDVEAAHQRNVCVTHTPGLSTEDIADFTLALLLCVARQVVSADKFVRSGRWSTERYPMTTRVSGKRIGIVGLGRIGRAVALRAEAFAMDVAYTGRSEKPDTSYRWCNDVQLLAASVDFLVICASANAETHALINSEVLEALGQKGILINIARGSIVDEQALIEALREGKILAAGLDVFGNEPHVSEALLQLNNVVVTPHMASTTEATVEAMLDLTLENLVAHFSGSEAISPIKP